MKVKVNDQPEMPSDLRRFFQQWLERERDTENASPVQRPLALTRISLHLENNKRFSTSRFVAFRVRY